MPQARPTKAFDDHPHTEFLFRLASDLGVWDVDDMYRRMPNDLLLRWQVYYRREHQREQLKIAEAQTS